VITVGKREGDGSFDGTAKGKGEGGWRRKTAVS
jgi:hypothetical protein